MICTNILENQRKVIKTCTYSSYLRSFSSSCEHWKYNSKDQKRKSNHKIIKSYREHVNESNPTPKLFLSVFLLFEVVQRFLQFCFFAAPPHKNTTFLFLPKLTNSHMYVLLFPSFAVCLTHTHTLSLCFPLAAPDRWSCRGHLSWQQATSHIKAFPFGSSQRITGL